MNINKKLLFVLLFFLLLNITVVSAQDTNSSEIEQSYDDLSLDNELNVSEDNQTVEKTTPSITIKSTSIKSKDTIEISLKNSSGDPLKSKKLTVYINGKRPVIKTDSNGVARLSTNLPAKSYKITVAFNGDDSYNSVSKSFTIKVSKLDTKLNLLNNFVVKGKKLYVYLYDQNLNSVAFKKLTIKFKGKTYKRTTNRYGCAVFKVSSKVSKYNIKIKFKADNYYKSSSKNFKFYVIKSMSLKIANSKLLTGGFLRVYLKDSASVWKKTIVLKVAGKKLSQKTSSEGIAIFKPNAGAKSYIVSAKYGKYVVSKKINCYKGNVKDPLKENVSFKNGVPDIDVMPKNYVMGDDNAKYTLTKSQYLEVLQKDSYSLFLHNKLTKYTFFKTKSHPNTYHIIKRVKWNVIERAINEKIVKKNKNGYWPGSVTVSLKGKSYSYPEVRDVQATGYTCGPTSASMCSQVLKNYFCEKYLAKIMKTDKQGTKCPLMIKALEKHNFKCSYFYKSTFNEALNELKNGGAALIFHANKHYVAILDISKDGKKVLVSNSYGSYDNIASKWIKVSYMKNKFSPQWDESLIVKLNYKLSDSTKNSVDCYYNSMGANWVAKNTNQKMGM